MVTVSPSALAPVAQDKRDISSCRSSEITIIVPVAMLRPPPLANGLPQDIACWHRCTPPSPLLWSRIQADHGLHNQFLAHASLFSMPCSGHLLSDIEMSISDICQLITTPTEYICSSITICYFIDYISACAMFRAVRSYFDVRSIFFLFSIDV